MSDNNEMYCPKCLSEYVAGVKMCADCGEELLRKNDEKLYGSHKRRKAEEDRAQKNRKIKDMFQYILGYLFVVVLSKILGDTIFIFVLVASVPFLIAQYLSSNQFAKIPGSIIDVIAYSNVVLWLVPILGFTALGATIGFYNNSAARKSDKKLIVLAIIGGLLSLINSILGIIKLI